MGLKTIPLLVPGLKFFPIHPLDYALSRHSLDLPARPEGAYGVFLCSTLHCNILAMSLLSSINHLSDNVAMLDRKALGALDARLIKSLQIRGDFPTSLNLLEKLKQVSASDSSVSQLSTVLQVDQVLALRLISIANYEYYRRETAVTTTTGAITQLGREKVVEIISHLAEAKNFNAIYLARAVSLTMMQQSIISAVIARQVAGLLCGQDASAAEEAYLVSTLINAPALVLAFLKPSVYSALCLDCLDDRMLFDINLKRLLGKSVGQAAAAVAETLSLPASFQQLALKYDSASWEVKEHSTGKQKDSSIIKAVHIGNHAAHEICYFSGIQGIQSMVRRLQTETHLAQSDLEDILGTVAEDYLGHSDTLGLKPLRLPEYLLWFMPVDADPGGPFWPSRLPGINERINPFLYEIRQVFKGAAADGGPLFTHAVHCTLNALVRGLNFDRAVFFTLDEANQLLQVAVPFGMKLFEPRKVRRALKDPERESMPDIQAVLQRKPVFLGRPVFPDGWPFVAFPVVWRDKVVGVFYADKVRRPDGDALESQEEIACIALAEEWHDVPIEFE